MGIVTIVASAFSPSTTAGQTTVTIDDAPGGLIAGNIQFISNKTAGRGQPVLCAPITGFGIVGVSGNVITLEVACPSAMTSADSVVMKYFDPTATAVADAATLAELEAVSAQLAGAATAAAQTAIGSVLVAIEGGTTNIPAKGSAATAGSTPITVATDDAQWGTDGTGITQPTGGSGARGWWSGAYAQALAIVASLGTDGAGESPANGTGVRGWLRSIYDRLVAGVGINAGTNIIGKVGIDQTTPGTTNGVVVNSSALPTGASTAAKQPALGAAGTPSADVLTVQGSVGGTALPVAQPTYGPTALAAATPFNGLSYGTLIFSVSAITGTIYFQDSAANKLFCVDLSTGNLITGATGVSAAGNYAVSGGISVQWTGTATVAVSGRA